MHPNLVCALAPGVLDAFTDAEGRAILAGGRVGLEKEALRVTADSSVATTPHPPALGSALTHPCITTDFSEALLELVTPALASSQEVLALLDDLHRFVYGRIGDERLWATSMPCVLHGGAQIPLAQYGSSNAGRMKTVYRRGLGNRYGRVMQVIAGVHFNYSVDDRLWQRLPGLPGFAARADARPGGADAGGEQALRADGYMGMVRNLQRLGWLVPYLFGASPAVCKSFVQNAATDLESFDATTFFYPYATSLRMGDIGYQNRQEAGTGMKACYDSLDAYIRSLTWAIETPCPQYETIGVKVNGRYEQLNDHVLQIENEYYSTVRPKQLTDWMERPTLALRRRGVLYVELRSVDVNACHPLGIDAEQMGFLRLFMLYSLLADGPRIDARERRAIDANQVLAAHRGREPGLRLRAGADSLTLRDWALRVLDAMQPLAELLDGSLDDGRGGDYCRGLAAQRAKVLDPELTPSARMLAEMRERGEGFAQFARRLTEQHRKTFLAAPPSPERVAWLMDLAATSLDRQRAIEAADDIDFDEFLRRYFAQSEAHPVELAAPV
ncbi:MAG: glutamate--cysteine ligase [Thiohalocapsa sp.]|jgi:glutamate--cysteine ligase|uniref:glutamate--cysteine ligase n=1 Tax=Thiohalocapsa sp. TaxID=2497641 RepID=UPI0025D0E671|nr:glutamate--cysteine ligase [Thiohalocapsa sp.]MCG6940800.1 glutamate--cysteine ligase [Thiohalocapsa sp.]